LAAVFAVVFLAAGFFAADFFAAVFFAAVFVAVAFFAAVFVAVAFFAAVFVAGAFFAGAFLVAALLAAADVFLAAEPATDADLRGLAERAGETPRAAVVMRRNARPIRPPAVMGTSLGTARIAPAGAANIRIRRIRAPLPTPPPGLP
jgi:hypothetical protein